MITFVTGDWFAADRFVLMPSSLWFLAHTFRWWRNVKQNIFFALSHASKVCPGASFWLEMFKWWLKEKTSCYGGRFVVNSHHTFELISKSFLFTWLSVGKDSKVQTTSGTIHVFIKHENDFEIDGHICSTRTNHQAEQIFNLTQRVDGWYALGFHYLFDVICLTNYQVERDDVETSMIGRAWEKDNRERRGIYYYDQYQREEKRKNEIGGGQEWGEIN